jgi:hypothetical protein
MSHQLNIMDHLIALDNYIKKVEFKVYTKVQQLQLFEVKYLFDKYSIVSVNIGAPTYGVYFCTYDGLRRALTPEGDS